MCLSSTARSSEGSEDTVIDVWGKKKQTEEHRIIQPGKNKVLSPTQLGGYRTDNSLKKISGFYLPDTGKNSSSSFSVPRSRGYDTRYTEIFLQNALLQDPYTGFTLSDDLDIREFGEMSIFQGWPDNSLPSLNPLGVISFSPVFSHKNDIEIGTDWGQAKGLNHWAILRNILQNDEILFQGRSFISYQYTDGRYQYYDDKMTPYNSSDDRLETRDNNDQRSHKFTHNFKVFYHNWQIWGTLRKVEKQRSIPAPSRLTTSHAREVNANHIAGTNVAYLFSGNKYFLKLGLGLKYHQDVLESYDEDKSLLNLQSAALTATTQSMNFFMEHDYLALNSTCQYVLNTSHVTAQIGPFFPSEISRDNKRLYCAFRLKLTEKTQVQLKGTYLKNSDKNHGNDVATFDQAANSFGKGGGIGFVSALNDQVIYTHFVVNDFPPSLVAQMGNASTIAPNKDLNNEQILHKEIGTVLEFFPEKNIKLNYSLFHDDLTQKIVFVPTSFGTTKAVNYGNFKIEGYEIDANFFKGKWTLNTNYARIFPVNMEVPEYAFIAGIPHDQGSNEIIFTHANFSLGLTSFYRGELSLDELGVKTLSSQITHDFSISLKNKSQTYASEILFLVQNLSDVTKTPVYAYDFKQNSGYVAYAQVEGYPLPGRNYQVSLSLKF